MCTNKITADKLLLVSGYFAVYRIISGDFHV